MTHHLADLYSAHTHVFVPRSVRVCVCFGGGGKFHVLISELALNQRSKVDLAQHL